MSLYFNPREIKRIVTFGDSWTAGHGVETDERYRDIARPEPFIHQLRISNSWPRWLSTAYDVPFVNLAEAGICNAGIKRAIENHHGWIDPEHDLVLVMWSFPYRHHQWMDILQHDEIALGDIFGRAQEMLTGYQYFFFNSFFDNFDQEPELLDRLGLARWLAPRATAAQALLQYEQERDQSVWEYGSRNVHLDQHGFRTGDYHPNLLGYRVVAEWVYNHLRPWHRM
jgi:hypothetical protein